MRFLSLIGSAESGSEHPLGKTIYQHVLALIEERKKTSFHLGELQVTQGVDFHAEAGQGVACKVGNYTVYLGNRAWMDTNDFGVNSYSLSCWPYQIAELLSTVKGFW